MLRKGVPKRTPHTRPLRTQATTWSKTGPEWKSAHSPWARSMGREDHQAAVADGRRQTGAASVYLQEARQNGR